MTAPIQLIGNVGSPYTRKMLSLLRYRRIEHAITWGDPSAELDKLGIPKPKLAFMPTFILENENGEAEAVCDSTPILRRLEKLSQERSVLPDDPALNFINYLLEDYADEWCTKFMFHYRWHFSADADNAGTQLPLSMGVTLAEDSLQQFKAFFSERQIGRLGYVGSNEITAPVIDASFRRLLQLLEAHFAQLPYLLGNKPSSADFALFGQLSQLIGFDPTPRAIAYDLSPRTVAWVSIMEDQSGLETDYLQWSKLDELPETLKDILRELAKTYVPALLANAEAIKHHHLEWQTQIDGKPWKQASFPYQNKCLHWIREEQKKLSPQDQNRLADLLSETGCDALL